MYMYYLHKPEIQNEFRDIRVSQVTRKYLTRRLPTHLVNVEESARRSKQFD